MRMNLTVLLLAILAFAAVAPLSAYSEPLTININTATAQELDEVLPGIGPTRAKAIVEYRQTQGPFKTLEDVDKVPGIGPKIFKLVSPHIRFNDGNNPPPAPTQVTPDSTKPQQPQQPQPTDNQPTPDDIG